MSAPRQRQRRPRVAVGHAPAMPRERKRRSKIPQGEDTFHWRAGEVVYGPPKTLEDILGTCWPVGRSK
jgi:hypothetical protein